MGLVFMEHAQRKMTGCGIEWAWPGPLVSMESWPCSNFPARLSSKVCITKKGFVDFVESLPFLPAVPASRSWKNYFVLPQAKYLIPDGLLAPPSYFGSFCRSLWNLIVFQVLHSPPLQELINTDLALSVPNEVAKDSQSRLLWSRSYPDSS